MAPVQVLGLEAQPFGVAREEVIDDREVTVGVTLHQVRQGPDGRGEQPAGGRDAVAQGLDQHASPVFGIPHPSREALVFEPINQVRDGRGGEAGVARDFACAQGS